MKINHLIACLFFGVSSLGFAASYTLTTGTAAGAHGIANSAGVTFQNSSNPNFAGPGIVGFGMFTSSDTELAAAVNPATLVGSFVGFGATPTGTFTAPGLTGNSGTFSRNSSGIVGGSAFESQNIYIFAGNGTTYENSTEFLVLKTDFTFTAAQDAIPTPEVLTGNPTNTTLLVGVLDPDVRTTTADSSVTPGWRTMVVIPEPSSALLAAIGALGLLRRRRN